MKRLGIATLCTTAVLLLIASGLPVEAGPVLRVVAEPDRQVRPGVTIDIWGASTANGPGNLGDGSSNGSAYSWAFTPNANVSVTDDGNLSGNVLSDRYINEAVSFTLLNGSTRESITVTLTVDGNPSNPVTYDIVDPTDPISTTPLDNLAIDTNIAIADGNRALLLLQDPTTDCWTSLVYGPDATPAVTGFSLWALENAGHNPTKDPDLDVYVDFVQRGLDCLEAFSQEGGIFAERADVAREATGAQTTDLNSNGVSQTLSDAFDQNYSHPIALAAFIASLDPGQYQTLVEDGIDYIGGAQSINDALNGFGRGGWDYSGPNAILNGGGPFRGGGGTGDRTDNSINSWNWMAIEGAQTTGFGVDAPDWILQESEYALVAQQVNAAGGQPFGYDDDQPLFGINDGQATTCAGLSGLAAVELENTVPIGDIIDDAVAPLNTIPAKRDSALQYLGDVWPFDSNGGLGSGNRGNFYVMWTCCRALRLTESTLGLDTDTLQLLNDGVLFNWSTGEENGSGNVPGAGEAREGYGAWIVRNQQADGSWDENTYLGGAALETPLSLLCLNPTVFGEAQCEDGDQDGFGDPGIPQCPEGPEEDCDDENPDVNPGVDEVCDNGIDDDCDGLIDLDDPDCDADCADNDGDGYGDGPDCLGPDCDDDDPDVNPGVDEVCDNGIDDDCDDLIDLDDPDCEPLLVVLDSFTAELTPKGVRIAWRTAMEIDTLGFRVLRGRTGDAELATLTDGLIPARGSELAGSEYRQFDGSRQEVGTTLYYYLEDVDRNGKVTRHGPAILEVDRPVVGTPRPDLRPRPSRGEMR